MHIHILGICGTFMGGVAILARSLGMKVTGADAGVYPPMSTQLESQGIELIKGFDSSFLQSNIPDLVVVGNAMSRGSQSVEYVLDHGIDYCSGPEFVYQYVLKNRWVLAVAGTHGKTTTSSMLAWILEHAGLKPGFLIGGIPQNFGVSARLGEEPFFVIEADEYDTAFFDKRSKFVHYHPRTLVLNNLEFDHADIFNNVDDIKRQFHHLLRIVPGSGRVINFADDENLEGVLRQGLWSENEKINSDGNGWWAKLLAADGSEFIVGNSTESYGTLKWSLIGDHNVNNAVAAIAAARHVGVPPMYAIKALSEYVNTKRRLEVRGVVNGVTVYDDFAHHPTAIQLTLKGLRAKVGKQRIIAVLEPRSNTMKLGFHKDKLAASLAEADLIYVYHNNSVEWDISESMASIANKTKVSDSVQAIVTEIGAVAEPNDHVVVMSNGGFENIHERLLTSLNDK